MGFNSGDCTGPSGRAWLEFWCGDLASYALDTYRRARINECFSECAYCNSKHLRYGSEVQAPVGLITIPDASGPNPAMVVSSFLHANVLTLLTRRVVRLKVDAAEKAGDEEFVGAELRDEGAAHGLRIARRMISGAKMIEPIGHDDLPGCEGYGFGGISFLFDCRLQLAFEIQERYLPLHRPDQFVAEREWIERFLSEV